MRSRSASKRKRSVRPWRGGRDMGKSLISLNEARPCKECGVSFKPAEHHQVFHSKKCAQKWHSKKHWRKRKDAEAKAPPRFCGVCNKPVPPGRRTYCSPTCSATYQNSAVRRRGGRTPHSHNASSQPNWIAAAKVATTLDLVDAIEKQIDAHPESRRVWELLRSRMERAEKQWRRADAFAELIRSMEDTDE